MTQTNRYLIIFVQRTLMLSKLELPLSMRVAEAYGGKWFASNVNRDLIRDQEKYLFGSKYLSGYFISNLPVSVDTNQNSQQVDRPTGAR